MVAQHAVDDRHVARPDRGRAPRSRPGGITPTPEVVTKTPSRLAPAHDLGVAGDDPHPGLFAPRAAMRGRRCAAGSAISQPSSMMKAADSQSGRAPPTARSFTVPQTAILPMSPPGNSSGVTTKLSVVKREPRARFGAGAASDQPRLILHPVGAEDAR